MAVEVEMSELSKAWSIQDCTEYALERKRHESFHEVGRVCTAPLSILGIPWPNLACVPFFFPPPTHGNKKVVYLMFKWRTEINPMKNVTEFVVMIIWYYSGHLSHHLGQTAQKGKDQIGTENTSTYVYTVYSCAWNNTSEHQPIMRRSLSAPSEYN